MRRQGNMFKGAMVMALAGAMAAGMAMTSFAAGWQKRSEEHTSELQSQR